MYSNGLILKTNQKINNSIKAKGAMRMKMTMRSIGQWIEL